MGQLKALVVDDEEMLADGIERYLKRKDFIVHKANRVEEGLRQLKKFHFDILITDMRLPDGLGIELIKILRQRNEKAAIICITGFSEEDYADIKKAGANFVMTKPFEKKELFSNIQSLMAS